MSDYQSPSTAEHRAAAPEQVSCAVVTVSDSRTLSDDHSGALIEQLLTAAGHLVAARTVVPDEPAAVAGLIHEYADGNNPQTVDAVLLTGGTGIARRDQTPEAVAELFTKQLPGFGELFRMLSYQEIGAAAMLSRSAGGVVNETVVLLMPGSTAAVRLAMEKLIVPELAHLVEHAK